MKHIYILSYSLDLALSNNYLQVTIKFLEPKVFNVKDDYQTQSLDARLNAASYYVK